MKKAVAFASLLLSSTSVSAEVVNAPNVTALIPSMMKQYGVSYLRMVMPGVLYRGGSTAGTEKAKAPLQSSSQQALCNDGFQAIVYGYGNNWRGGSGVTVTCAKGQATYVSKRWDHPNEIHDVMKELHNVIVQRNGAMYVHCWYGVHASGTLAATALRQFCGLSGDQAVRYWESTVTPSSLWYPNVISAIRNFQPDPALNISQEDKERVCPTAAQMRFAY
jgi:hypothetical protein